VIAGITGARLGPAGPTAGGAYVPARAAGRLATPAPTYAFSTGTTSATRVNRGGNPADSTVAASRTHICITTRAAFACYTKGGALVSPGAGLDARPYRATDFFAASGLPIAVAFDGSAGNLAKDGRVLFDAIHERFFMVFQTRESKGRLMIAVSKTQDPRDGWWTYADSVAQADANTHDYLRIGVTAKHFLVTNFMVNCTPKAGGGFDCNKVRTRHLLYTSSELRQGAVPTRTEWTHADAAFAGPCVNNSTSSDAYWVNRDDDTHATVWAVRDGKVTRHQVEVKASVFPVNNPQLGGLTVIYTNPGGRGPQNAEYRDGRIVWVSNDGYKAAGQATADRVRLFRFNVSQFFTTGKVTVEIDRAFGGANAADPPGSKFDYGWPAVATNADGDIVVGEIRSNPSTYPELRASVWFAGQADISSSVSLQTSSSPLQSFHMAGASADPTTKAVYLSQQFGSTTPAWRIRVSKMLGVLVPDLIATAVTAPSTLKKGKTGTVAVTVLNQGDKTMPATNGDLRLSLDNTITSSDTLLASFPVPALAPNQQTVINVPITVPPAQATGSYRVGPYLDQPPVAQEYSETNNANPFLAGDHGNAAIAIGP
jgi:hypothetical protein